MDREAHDDRPPPSLDRLLAEFARTGKLPVDKRDAQALLALLMSLGILA